MSSGISIAGAESVIDASKEWQIHQSSFSTPSPSPEATPKSDVHASSEPVCDCETLTPQEQLEESTYAFTGIVEDVQKVKNGRRVVIFETGDIYKGSPDPDMKVEVEVHGTSCDLSMEAGQSYMVFAHWAWGSNVTSRCMGTKFLEKAKRAALGASEELKEKLYIHLRNACMGRMDTSCCLASLKEMRVGYYVPQPEAGCPEGTGPDRLRCGGSYSWCVPFSEKTHR